jgi:CheY-like chemotaxis protein
MSSNLVRPVLMTASSRSSSRVLVIEPDAERAGSIRDALSSYPEADVVVVKRLQDALRSIGEQIPDLVLTSTLLSPADEAALTAHLKRLPEASHVQLVNLPYFIDGEGEDSSRSTPLRMMGLLGLRTPTIRPRCDVETLRKQIDAYLVQAAAIRFERQHPRETSLIVAPRKTSGSSLRVAAQSTPSVTLPGGPNLRLRFNPNQDRRRNRRRSGEDVPSLWSVRLPWGDALKVVNISNTGVLLESASKIAPGSTIKLHLLGEETNISVSARAIRSDVANVDGFGVKYHLAAAFSQEVLLPGIDMPDVDAPVPAATPRALIDLVARVLGEGESVARPSELRIRFESDLRRLLRLRDVQIRETPAVAGEITESIYFTIPESSGRSRVLQVFFEPGEALSDMDFRILKAAANAAALVLELGPSMDTAPAKPPLVRS